MGDNRRLAKAFAIVGFEGRRLLEALELNFNERGPHRRRHSAGSCYGDEDDAAGVDPDVLFLYPHEDASTRAVLESIIETKFSRPNGFQIVTMPRQPDFRTIRHTDPNCTVTYLSVFSFYETVSNRTASFTLYVPKFLVVISTIQHSDLFKNCLRAIYEKMVVEGSDRDCLNRAIASIIHYPPPPPGASSQLSLGFGEPLTVHTPSAKSVPRTGLTVYRLVQALGPEQTVSAFFCLLNQLQVTMYSADVNFLTDSCEAMLALFYPFEYCFLYAPIQTKRCLERFNTLENPTPFFIGICEPPEEVLIGVQNKVVLVDLDKKIVHLPPSVQIDADKVAANHLLESLQSIVSSQDFIDAQAAAEINISKANLIEKRLRACFLLFHASLICDYRQSLSAVRIHPQPRIFFDKAHFFGRRNLKYRPQGGSFLSSFVDIFLEQFLKDRKLPVREADFFDELCAMLSAFSSEMISSEQLIDDLAKYLAENDKLSFSERNHASGFALRSLTTLRPRALPVPNRTRITKFSYEMACHHQVQNDSPASNSVRHGRIMASPRHQKTLGGQSDTFPGKELDGKMAIYNVYMACIFGRDYKKAKEFIPNIFDAIEAESLEIRRRISEKLQKYANSQTELEEKQFSAIGKLVHALLKIESAWDENGMAAALLPLLQNLRLINTRQCLYTAVQKLPVWRNEAFWVALACRHIAADVAARYEQQEKPDLANEPCHSVDVLAKILEKEEQGNFADIASEEAIAQTWCLHFANLMICFLVEFDVQSNSETSGNDSGISFDEGDRIKSPPLNKSKHTVEYYVTYALEEIWKETDLPPSGLEEIKTEILGKIADHVKFIQSLRSNRPERQRRHSAFDNSFENNPDDQLAANVLLAVNSNTKRRASHQFFNWGEQPQRA